MSNLRFDGSDYKPSRDESRLTKQYHIIFTLMSDGLFRTLGQIESITNCPQASISARLRDFRKQRNGSHTVNKRYIDNGLYEYQLVIK